MRPLGFSTGALALSDFRLGIEISKRKAFDAIEVSALREAELLPMLRGLSDQDLAGFAYVSIHAPSQFPPESEEWIFQALYEHRGLGWPIIVHPDTLYDVSLWRLLGDVLCIENMDLRKPVARTVNEMEKWFADLPEASFCFDIGHARQVDSSMVEAYLMLKRFGPRLRQVHISEVNSRSKHDPLSFTSILNFQEVAALIPERVPVIIESVVSQEQIEGEVRRVLAALSPAATPLSA